MKSEEITSGISISNETKKRGRRSKQENYFDTTEEMAVRMFLLEDTFEGRNKIYNQYLRDPLDKMISSIIRRYKLYRKDMHFEEIHADTHSFLMTKIDKFKPAKEKKAYSYFGTICKNYLMGQIIKDQKEMNRKISYEDISASLEEDVRFSYKIESDELSTETLINDFKCDLRLFIDKNQLNDNEKKLGIALLEIFENYETMFSATDNNKFNKNIVLLSLREMTNLTTKEIRSAMKKYKKLYLNILSDVLKN
jgi:hypothetical protein